jgi:hypothetical protein
VQRCSSPLQSRHHRSSTAPVQRRCSHAAAATSPEHPPAHREPFLFSAARLPLLQTLEIAHHHRSSLAIHNEGQAALLRTALVSRPRGFLCVAFVLNSGHLCAISPRGFFALPWPRWIADEIPSCSNSLLFVSAFQRSSAFPVEPRASRSLTFSLESWSSEVAYRALFFSYLVCLLS